MIAYLAQIGDAILNAGSAGLVVGTTGRPAPTAYLVHEPVVFDQFCEDGQLTVSLRRVFLAPLGDESANTPPWPGNCCAGIWKAEYVLTLIRCVTNLDTQGKPAPTATQDADATALMEDLWALLTQLDDQLEAGTLFDPAQLPGIRCQDVTVGEAIPVPIDGNGAGWEIPITVRLNDSGPTGS